jgi:hypothetical protein
VSLGRANPAQVLTAVRVELALIVKGNLTSLTDPRQLVTAHTYDSSNLC